MLNNAPKLAMISYICWYIIIDIIMKNNKILHSVILSVIFFALGAIFGWQLTKHQSTPTPTLTREDSLNYKFIRPVLLLQVPEDDSSPQFVSLKKSVTTYVTNAIHANNASDVSVYFRELNTNNWIGVNTDDTYSPASMLKVITLVAFLRASESNPDLLDEAVTLDVPSAENEDTNQDYYPSENQAKIGGTYTTEQLLSYMIDDSDNNSALTLSSLIGAQTLNQTFTDFNIPNNNENAASDFMSVKMYSRIWRALYDGTYISQTLSNQALDLLSHTTFTEGLVAGVPAGTTVSHKFGERTINIQSTSGNAVTSQTRELHDCGIVYAPNNPYFICVMTKGNDFTVLQKIISDLSAIAWKQVASESK